MNFFNTGSTTENKFGLWKRLFCIFVTKVDRNLLYNRSSQFYCSIVNLAFSPPYSLKTSLDLNKLKKISWYLSCIHSSLTLVLWMVTTLHCIRFMSIYPAWNNLPKVPSYIGLGFDKSDTQMYHSFKCVQIGTKPEIWSNGGMPPHCCSYLQECIALAAFKSSCLYHTAIQHHNIIDQWWPDELEHMSNKLNSSIGQMSIRKKIEGRWYKQVHKLIVELKPEVDEESIGEECFSVQPQMCMHPKKPLFHAWFSCFALCNCTHTQVAESPKSDQIGCAIWHFFSRCRCQ